MAWLALKTVEAGEGEWLSQPAMGPAPSDLSPQDPNGRSSLKPPDAEVGIS